MANTYGLDFLRTEHTLNEYGEPKQEEEDAVHSSSAAVALTGDELAAEVAHKPDLERQFDVIQFLQKHRSRRI